MGTELYNDGKHICVAFRDLIASEAVQANQFLIFDSDHAALIDPGGELTYSDLYLDIAAYMNVKTMPSNEHLYSEFRSLRILHLDPGLHTYP